MLFLTLLVRPFAKNTGADARAGTRIVWLAYCPFHNPDVFVTYKGDNRQRLKVGSQNQIASFERHRFTRSAGDISL